MDPASNHDRWLDDLIAAMGTPIPCHHCATPTQAAELTETTEAAGVISFGTGDVPFVLWEIVWLCPGCVPA